ncbi:unnamed protein product [Hymenolepis diminuta]|uniref:Uncharacterized protein n=1 Tax=Hymenolepis diminuta TaxID=6216 RepID=A0A564YKJ8_HYMDI|nr:unnamed protein product [Hymenolepis diminuta]
MVPFGLPDLRAISRDHFKCLPFLSDLRELCPTHVCFRFLTMIKASDNITPEDFPNECRKFDFKCSSVMSQKEPREYDYVGGISGEPVSQNMFSIRKTLTEYWLVVVCILFTLVRANAILATCVANKDIRKRYAERNPNSE